MRIGFRQIRGDSGVDVWARNLCHQLNSLGHSCDIRFFPKLFEPVPDMIHFYDRTKQDDDIVHGNSWNAFAFKSDAPLVVTEHLVVHDPAYIPYKSLSQRFYHRIIRKYEERSLSVADAVVCVSRYTQKKLREAFGYSQSRVIYNGVDPQIFRPVHIERTLFGLPDDKIILFYSGNLTRRKGADLLPPIMKELGDKYLLITTAGLQSRWKPVKNMRNFGMVSLENLIALYNLADIYLFPTRLEGLSLSVLEAMACAKPVISSEVASLPEQVIDGGGGFLCKGDSVGHFTEKIRYLSEDHSGRERMGTFNRERVLELFTMNRMTEEYLSLYQKMTG